MIGVVMGKIQTLHTGSLGQFHTLVVTAVAPAFVRSQFLGRILGIVYEHIGSSGKVHVFFLYLVAMFVVCADHKGHPVHLDPEPEGPSRMVLGDTGQYDIISQYEVVG